MFERIDSHLEFDRELHRFKLDGRPVPSFTQCLKAAGLIDDRFFTDYARDRGSSIHEATRFYDENDLDAAYLEGCQTGYLEAWDLFKRETGFKAKKIEVPVYSISLQIAGIPDRVGPFGGDDYQSVVEIKTGELYPVTGIQLSMQQACIDPPPKRRIGVRLFEDGHYEWKEFKDRNDWQIAKAAISITHWLRAKTKGEL